MTDGTAILIWALRIEMAYIKTRSEIISTLDLPDLFSKSFFKLGIFVTNGNISTNPNMGFVEGAASNFD